MQIGVRFGMGLAVWLSIAASPALAQSATAPAPAADFGTGAAACTVALAPAKLDEAALKNSGWAASSTRSIATVYQREGVGVRLFLSTMIAPSGQCVVDGYATADDQFAAIRDAIRAALAEKYGAPPMMPAQAVPNGQGFVVDNNLVLILSADKRPAGLSIRITCMRFPKN